MRVLIVDDEPAARRRLALMLEELDVEVAGEAANGVRALEQIAALRPDVVLLDIQMRELSGIDVARHLPEPRPLVVFQTAHDSYALQAFEQEAVDYVLKPVSLERLRRALERAAARLREATRPRFDAELVARLEAALGTSRPAWERILVRDATGQRLIALREVVRCTANEGEVVATTTAGRFRCDYTLDELESRLSPGFVRASRGDLVNVAFVQGLTSAGDGSAKLSLANGQTVLVSRRRATAVRRRLEGLE
ncbi:MAG TPA: response regulator [Gemmatimonadaceae bacterium]|nr:response regulator [Gemmatimonadaceae bacterium]